MEMQASEEIDQETGQEQEEEQDEEDDGNEEQEDEEEKDEIVEEMRSIRVNYVESQLLSIDRCNNLCKFLLFYVIFFPIQMRKLH